MYRHARTDFGFFLPTVLGLCVGIVILYATIHGYADLVREPRLTEVPWILAVFIPLVFALISGLDWMGQYSDMGKVTQVSFSFVTLLAPVAMAHMQGLSEAIYDFRVAPLFLAALWAGMKGMAIMFHPGKRKACTQG